MEKYIKDVFMDFKDSSNLLDARLSNVNLYKKQDKLQVDIISNKPITIEEIGKFENYLISNKSLKLFFIMTFNSTIQNIIYTESS